MQLNIALSTRLDGNSFTSAITTVNDFTIDNTDVGTYTIQIVAIGYDQSLKKESLPAIATFLL